jgi:parallel beta-helix repeat protein
VVEDNQVSDTALAAVEIRDPAKTAPVVHGNQITGGKAGGIVVRDGAAPVVEDNQISDTALAAVEIRDPAKTAPVVRGNRITGGRAGGIFVHDGAAPVVEDNQISDTALAAVEIRDPAKTAPVVRGNQITGGKAGGIYVFDGAAPVVEDNTISKTSRAGVLLGDNTNAKIQNNIITCGRDRGIHILTKAGGIIQGNQITRNARAGIELQRRNNAEISANNIYDGKGSGMLRHDKSGQIRDNIIYGNRFGNSQKGPTGSHVTISDMASAGFQDEDTKLHGTEYLNSLLENVRAASNTLTFSLLILAAIVFLFVTSGQGGIPQVEIFGVKLENAHFLYSTLPAVAAYLWAQFARAGLVGDRATQAYIFAVREIDPSLYSAEFADFFPPGAATIFSPFVAGGMQSGLRRIFLLVTFPLGLLLIVGMPVFEIWSYAHLIGHSQGSLSTIWALISFLIAALFGTYATVLQLSRIIEFQRFRNDSP